MYLRRTICHPAALLRQIVPVGSCRVAKAVDTSSSGQIAMEAWLHERLDR